MTRRIVILEFGIGLEPGDVEKDAEAIQT